MLERVERLGLARELVLGAAELRLQLVARKLRLLRARAGRRSWYGTVALYRLYLGIADGMSTARVWTRRYPK